jgi:putative transposase
VIPLLGEAESDEGLKFSDAQKAFIRKQDSDGMPVADICRKAGGHVFHLEAPTETRRVRQLEDENTKLSKIAADLSFDKEMLQDVIRRRL